MARCSSSWLSKKAARRAASTSSLPRSICPSLDEDCKCCFDKRLELGTSAWRAPPLKRFDRATTDVLCSGEGSKFKDCEKKVSNSAAVDSSMLFPVNKGSLSTKRKSESDTEVLSGASSLFPANCSRRVLSSRLNRSQRPTSCRQACDSSVHPPSHASSDFFHICSHAAEPVSYCSWRCSRKLSSSARSLAATAELVHLRCNFNFCCSRSVSKAAARRASSSKASRRSSSLTKFRPFVDPRDPSLVRPTMASRFDEDIAVPMFLGGAFTCQHRISLLSSSLLSSQAASRSCWNLRQSSRSSCQSFWSWEKSSPLPVRPGFSRIASAAALAHSAMPSACSRVRLSNASRSTKRCPSNASLSLMRTSFLLRRSLIRHSPTAS